MWPHGAGSGSAADMEATHLESESLSLKIRLRLPRLSPLSTIGAMSILALAIPGAEEHNAQISFSSEPIARCFF